ncbi:gluconate 2-dehydrogenase subunit 3 family protein [Sphingosinicella sp. BN140058]|uniref:gluconate 2-dehydrogenase subunit 3 family protein n=1 Tax=Sphingosinicella sp. BN140058 TaxID=1892855 RepID=UPI0013EBC5BA|nr:gluconate 2-dehydrogenase subunit 3 family protein [Sphingosinicella sp. BN140058]
MSSVAVISNVDRRMLLRSAILLVGGSLTGLPEMALAQAAEAAEAPFFTPAQTAVLAEYADIMIPRTDTPGAKDAGVPENFDALMRHWASEQRRDDFRALVEEIGGAGLLSRPAGAERLAFVRGFDADKLKKGDPVYGKFKELVMTLYYLSEAGATKELRYELVPGKWEPATTIGTDTRAWAV